MYLAARSEEKAKAAIAEIQQTLPDPKKGQVEFLKLDLSHGIKAKEAAEEFKRYDQYCENVRNRAWLVSRSKETKLHLLFNNAGIRGVPKGSKSPDGYELHWATNGLYVDSIPSAAFDHAIQCSVLLCSPTTCFLSLSPLPSLHPPGQSASSTPLLPVRPTLLKTAFPLPTLRLASERVTPHAMDIVNLWVNGGLFETSSQQSPPRCRAVSYGPMSLPDVMLIRAFGPSLRTQVLCSLNWPATSEYRALWCGSWT